MRLFLLHFLPPALVTLLVVGIPVLSGDSTVAWLGLVPLWLLPAALATWRDMKAPIWQIHKAD